MATLCVLSRLAFVGPVCEGRVAIGGGKLELALPVSEPLGSQTDDGMAPCDLSRGTAALWAMARAGVAASVERDGIVPCDAYP